MISRKWLLATVALATVALAGCGGGATVAKAGKPAGRLLKAAEAKISTTPVAASFSGVVTVTNTGVAGLSQSFRRSLKKLQSQLNSAQLTGTAQFQGPGTFSATINYPLLNSTLVHLLEVGGKSYLSTNGTTWYQSQSSAGSASRDATAAGGLRSELAGTFSKLTASVKVTELGTSQLHGIEVREMESQIPGSDLQSLLSTLASTHPSSSAAGESGQLLQFLQFSPVKVLTYVAIATGRVEQVSVSAGAGVSLTGLGLIDPSAANGTPSGTVKVSLSLTSQFSDYGANFNITPPSQVLPGTPTFTAPTLAGSSGFLPS